mmetsp:Transcript_14377/g.13966  ORF Transcript_14377/g.13966 Transcript_14377/m.13966 type:complete len:97 (-) Transcript_14377:1943-2233(-)
MSKKLGSNQQPKSEVYQLTEALVDLYLSVKIRSNDEIDNYSETMLTKERKRLRDIDAFTILDYIKTSIEILMNMKMEENGGGNEEGKKTRIKNKES